eukprot:2997034-Amphidinium_carterae.1
MDTRADLWVNVLPRLLAKRSSRREQLQYGTKVPKLTPSLQVSRIPPMLIAECGMIGTATSAQIQNEQHHRNRQTPPGPPLRV